MSYSKYYRFYDDILDKGRRYDLIKMVWGPPFDVNVATRNALT